MMNRFSSRQRGGTMLESGMPPIPVECACCDTRLNSDDLFCNQCQTPASVSRSVAGAGGREQFVSVLGASNAGKTVYLGLMLDILGKGPNTFHGMATNPFSIELQEQVVTALQRRVFPDKTPSEVDAWKWMHCKVVHGSGKSERRLDLISPDFAGEAIAMEIEEAGMYPVIGHVVRKSSGIMILCDSQKLRDGGVGEDLFAMKIASYIADLHQGSNLHQTGSGGYGIMPALAIVFTKADHCKEASADPTAFAKNNASRLFEFCRIQFPHHAYFAVGVAGGSGLMVDENGSRRQVPFHIQPSGVLDPLRWLVTHS